MSLVQQQRYTGTLCANGHEEYVVTDYLKTGGVLRYVTEHGPKCWIAGCAANREATAKEQQR
jgi:hypothetical protein